MEYNDPFGGITVFIVGYVAEPPPVGVSTVWNYTTSNIGNDLTSTNLFKQFKYVAILRENHRFDHNDKDSVICEGFCLD
jgi:hypothetical protein